MYSNWNKIWVSQCINWSITQWGKFFKRFLMMIIHFLSHYFYRFGFIVMYFRAWNDSFWMQQLVPLAGWALPKTVKDSSQTAMHGPQQQQTTNSLEILLLWWIILAYNFVYCKYGSIELNFDELVKNSSYKGQRIGL